MGVADVEQGTHAPETSSAKAAPAGSKKAETLDNTAPAPCAAQTYGQVVQPGFPVVPCERPVNTPITHGEAEGCCNIQWVLFVVGFFFVPASYAGAALPLCSKPSFPTRCHKYGWIANLILSTAYTVIIIAAVATSSGASSASSSSTSAPPTYSG